MAKARRAMEVNGADYGGRGVLVDAEIRKLELIEVPESDGQNQQCFKPASYDLRLGHEYIQPGNVVRGLNVPEILDCRNNGGRVCIEPFSSIIVSTYEIVRLPDNVVGKFNLRIKQAFRGLIVQMGTQVEPNYRGRLYALLQMTCSPICPRL